MLGTMFGIFCLVLGSTVFVLDIIKCKDKIDNVFLFLLDMVLISLVIYGGLNGVNLI